MVTVLVRAKITNKIKTEIISSMILELILAEAKLMGLSKVALHISKDGEILYRKFGFSEPVYPYLELV